MPILRLAVVLVSVWSAVACADSLHLTHTFASHHTMTGDFTERNPGYGVQYQQDDWPVYANVGHYKNSYGDGTAYLTVGREWRNQFIGVGIEGGLVLGYNKPLVGVLPYVSIGPERANVKTYVMPTTKGMVFGFQARLMVW